MQAVAELPFIAGHVALDFVNTAEERGHPDASDVLRTPADLRLWGQRYGLLAERPGRAADDEADRAEFGRAVEARELLYALFRARRTGRPAPAAQVARLAELAATAYRAGALRLAPDGTIGWNWSRSDLATVRHVAVTGAIDLLSAEPSTRLKQCPGDHCGWFFLDTTKRGNRRWCSMGECGQEAKDERRRARRQANARAAGGPDKTVGATS
jgi:predicted RNA-binding Zn ribbon-like protein